MFKQKSFTLIELLVVIVIIGILAGVIMFSTSSAILKANFAKAKAFSANIKDSIMLDLVSEWDFDDTSLPYNDSWGSNNCSLIVPTGITSPEIKTDECVSGSCLYFYNMVGNSTDGSYLDCGFLPRSTSVWTEEVWIKSSENGRMPMTLGKASIYGSYGIAWSGNTWYPRIGNIYDNKWHHLVFTYSETALINEDNIFAYVDGKLVAQGNKTWGAVSSPIFIGRGYDWGSTGNYPYRGFVDEIKIYNNYIPFSQIKQNYVVGLSSLLAQGNMSKQEYNERIKGLSFK